MKFDASILRGKNKIFRQSWEKDHFLTFNGEVFLEHLDNEIHVWFYDLETQYKKAFDDLTANDWAYV